MNNSDLFQPIYDLTNLLAQATQQFQANWIEHSDRNAGKDTQTNEWP